jgi:subtilisin family serine protease
MKFLFLLSLIAFTSYQSSASSGEKYWIYLKDKDYSEQPAISSATLKNRQERGLPLFDSTDLPLRNDYVSTLSKASVRVIQRSKWLNAVSAQLSPEALKEIKKLDFVKDVVKMDSDFFIARTAPIASPALLAPVMEQVQSDVFTSQKLTGKGVTIGVIDAGFYAADSSELLNHLFSKKKILGIRDYVKPDQDGENLYSVAESYSDMHGTEVLSAIAGLDKREHIQYGMALNSKFYLARTDYSLREWRGEEDNWIAALEWMDSLGVKLVNTSLGYARGFTDPSENYEPNQMDGKSTAISRAAQLAADQKGMLLIVSAGNEGEDKTWKIITAPADAKGVLSVGATNQQQWTRIGYSSIGPEDLGYLKPNVACYSLYGTSLSAPVITGFAACLMEQNPQLNNKQLIEIIEKSAHLYPFGNNYVGYGVPLASRALELAKKPYLPSRNIKITAKGRSIDLPVNTVERSVPIYRKRNEKDVIVQQTTSVVNGKVSLRRQSQEKFTTIDLKNYAVEVAWE